MRLIERTSISRLAQAQRGRTTPPASAIPLSPATSRCACGGSCPRCATNLAQINISEPGGFHEQEADRMAAKVATGLPASASATDKADSVAKEDPRIRAGDSEIGLNGKPLSPELRARFEPGLGADLSQVRIHTGPQAQALAAPLQAEAFTLGRHIVIGDPYFQAASSDGQNLLAHELAHTIQQGAAGQAGAARTAGSSGPMIMRRLIRTASINFLCGSSDPFLRSPPSGFMHLNTGETQISISTNIQWDRPASCGSGSQFFMTLFRHRSVWWDANEGTKTLNVGTPDAAVWSGLDEDSDYYFEIRSNNTNPNCCLTGSIDVNTP